MNVGVNVPPAITLLLLELDRNREELLLARPWTVPSGEKDWLRVCMGPLAEGSGEFGEDTFVDFERACPEDGAGEGLTEAFRLKGLFRHLGPFCAGTLIVLRVSRGLEVTRSSESAIRHSLRSRMNHKWFPVDAICTIARLKGMEVAMVVYRSFVPMLIGVVYTLARQAVGRDWAATLGRASSRDHGIHQGHLHNRLQMRDLQKRKEFGATPTSFATRLRCSTSLLSISTYEYMSCTAVHSYSLRSTPSPYRLLVRERLGCACKRLP